MKKRRHGNMLITVAVFAGLVIVLSGMFSLVIAQKNNALKKGNSAGSLDSYVAIANLCADCFKSQFESKGAQFTPTVDNPTAEYGSEIFDTSLQLIQQNLSDGNISEDGSWVWKVKNPKTVIEYASIMDNEDAAALANELLDNAVLKVTVSGGFSVTDTGERHPEINAKDVVDVDPIFFTVVLRKGTTEIVQNYKLEGELMTRRHDTDADDNIVRVNINIYGKDAANTLLGQTASRTSVRSSE